ncbi:MAG TPA: inositol monophosphatase family protein [Acidimicrobiales bacterium]
MDDLPAALLDELFDIARQLATRASALLLDGLDRDRAEVSTKSSTTDMVTEVDRASERLIVDGILERRPDDGIVGEEGADIAGTSGVRWLIDPIDGTTNYLYRHPGFAVSIAAQLDGITVAGVVRDPVHGDEFGAVRGRGATRNGRAIHVVDHDDLQTALVATGFAYDPEARARQAVVLTHVLPRIRDIRRVGAAAVDLCSVAIGRVNAYYERGLEPWDLAAGELVASESGAIVGSLDGPARAGGVVIAAPRSLFGPLRDLLNTAGAGDA